MGRRSKNKRRHGSDVDGGEKKKKKKKDDAEGGDVAAGITATINDSNVNPTKKFKTTHHHGIDAGDSVGAVGATVVRTPRNNKNIVKKNTRNRNSRNSHSHSYSHNRQRNSNKRPNRRGRFWIEDCIETTAPNRNQNLRLENENEEEEEEKHSGTYDGGPAAMPSIEVLITRSDLVDDYRQVPQKKKYDDHDDDHHDGTAKKNHEHCVVVEGAITDSITPASSQHTSQQDRDCEDSNIQKDVALTASNQVPAFRQDDQKVFVAVKLSNSVKKPRFRNTDFDAVENFAPLPNGDCGDGIVNPFPTDEVPDKFWSQRRRLFTRFDDGIQLDKESWYSVTPESIAKHIAGHLTANRYNVVVLDLFCGCGGNAIQFALQGAVDVVVCVDKDVRKLVMAASNAAIYGVPTTKMVFIHDHASHILACYEQRKLREVPNTSSSSSSVRSSLSSANIDDASASNKNSPLNRGEVDSLSSKTTTAAYGFRIGGIELLPKRINCIFLSPPWGGIDYGKVGKRNYTLQCIQLEPPSGGGCSGTAETGTSTNNTTMIDGEDILVECARALGNGRNGGGGPIAIFLPKNINGVSLGKSVFKAGYDGPVIMEQNILNGKLKTVTAYIGLH